MVTSAAGKVNWRRMGMDVDEILEAHTDGTLTADALFELCEDYRRLRTMEARAREYLSLDPGELGPARAIARDILGT
jgi:hypothetical protein